MMENIDKQSRLHSLIEALNVGLFAAPTAILLHKLTLMIAGENALNENQDFYVTLSWVMFFLHSIAWKYVIRRVHEHYGLKLDPKNIARNIYKRLKYGVM